MKMAERRRNGRITHYELPRENSSTQCTNCLRHNAILALFSRLNVTDECIRSLSHVNLCVPCALWWTECLKDERDARAMHHDRFTPRSMQRDRCIHDRCTTDAATIDDGETPLDEILMEGLKVF